MNAVALKLKRAGFVNYLENVSVSVSCHHVHEDESTDDCSVLRLMLGIFLHMFLLFTTHLTFSLLDRIQMTDRALNIATASEHAVLE